MVVVEYKEGHIGGQERFRRQTMVRIRDGIEE